MAQYRYFSEGQLKVDPTTGTKCRTGQLNHQFVEQKFVGGVWVGIGDNDGARYGDVAGAGCRFREGMWDGDYTVDVEIEVAGFLLAEGDGWVNCGSVEGYFYPKNLNYMSGEHAIAPLTLPNPYADNTCIHPYVIDFLLQYNIPLWNGYRYWMGFTPFAIPAVPDPSIEENPCIVASNDGITWVTPAGLSNPIEDTPGGNQYNADITLYYDVATNTLHALWTRSLTYLRESHSTDGVTWSAPITIINITDAEYNGKISSSSFVKVGAKIYLYTGNYRFEGSLITGVWSNPVLLTTDVNSVMAEINTYTTTQDLTDWHHEVRYYKGWFFRLMYMRGSDGYQFLWMSKSKNGIDFIYAKYPVLSKYYNFGWDRYHYKSSFIPYEINGKVTFEMWYVGENLSGSDPFYQLGYSSVTEKEIGLTINVDSNIINAFRSAELVKANALSDGYSFGDDCNRADGALGLSSCGKAYVGVANFLIANNLLVNKNATASEFNIINMPVNYEWIIQMYNNTVTTGGADVNFYIYPKLAAPSNQIRIQEGQHATKGLRTYSGSTLRNQKYVFRSFLATELNEFKIIFNGTNIKYYVNGMLYFEHTFVVTDFSSQITMDASLASTTIGMVFLGNTNERIKNITVKAL